MTSTLVATHFVWDEYPGLRIGRIYSGSGDLGRHPRGVTHAIAAADSAVTVCGLDRATFPYDFAESVNLRDCEPCPGCEIGSPAPAASVSGH